MPEADTYGIQVKLGPSEAEVPTATSDTKICCVVAAMLVSTSFSVQVPVRVVFEGLGAKHDTELSDWTAYAKAPDDRSWRICNPGPAPVHSDNCSWKPVILRAPSNRKSW